MAGSARVSKTTVVERVEREDHLDEDGVEVMLVVVHVRPSKGTASVWAVWAPPLRRL